MALARTSQAIGAVSRLLIDHLTRRTSLPISCGLPEAAAGGSAQSLNLFLYEAVFDPSLKNHSLAPGRIPPLWFTLKYLLTAFGEDGGSNSPSAHEALGRGLAALQELSFLGLDEAVAPAVIFALEDNPEPLKLTFDDCTAELVNKLTQTSDDGFRLSAAFQVRPVMIVPAERPAFQQLVGVNYTTTPVSVTSAPVGLDILASLGPRITALSSEAFVIGDTIQITGEDLHVSHLTCWLGSVEMGIVRQTPVELTVRIETLLESGTLLSAGEHPLVLRQSLPASGRSRPSNTLLGRLLPTISTATPGAFTADSEGHLSGNITLTGFLLGRSDDSILVALHHNGAVAHLFEITKAEPAAGDPPDSQQELILTIPTTARVTAGTYLVMVVVNGQQARQSPPIQLTA